MKISNDFFVKISGFFAALTIEMKIKFCLTYMLLAKLWMT